MLIELDEVDAHTGEWSEEFRVSCLLQGAEALERSAQHHCALVLRDLHSAFEEVDRTLHLNASKPVQAVYEMLDAIMTMKVFEEG
jgi:hypothetical protein